VSHSEADRNDTGSFLSQGLVLGERFSLYVVAVESIDAQQRVIDELEGTPELRVKVVDVGDGAERLDLVIGEGMTSLLSVEGRAVVVVTGLDQRLARDPDVFRRLNEHRNELRRRAPGGVVLMGGPKVVEALRSTAPDTWSVRAADLDVSAGPRELAFVDEPRPRFQLPASPGTEQQLSVLAKEHDALPRGDRRGRVAIRMAEILDGDRTKHPRAHELYVEGADDVGSPRLRMMALINAMRTLPWPDSEEALERLPLLARESEAEAWLDLASYAWMNFSHRAREVARNREALDAAERALELSSRTSDAHFRAEARSALAEARAAMGELDAALDAWAEVISELQQSPLLPPRLIRAGMAAALAGRKDLIDAYWGAYVREPLDGGGAVELHWRRGDLCRALASMAMSSAEALAWDVLVELSAEWRMSMLMRECVGALVDLVGVGRDVALDRWEARLGDLGLEEALVAHVMAVLRARMLAAGSRLDEAERMLADVPIEPLWDLDSTLGYLATSVRIAALDARFRAGDADTLMEHVLGSEHRAALLHEVAMVSRRGERLEGLLEPDQRLVAVLLRTLGSSGLDPEAAARSQPA